MSSSSCSPLDSTILFIQLHPALHDGDGDASSTLTWPSLDAIAEQLAPYAKFRFHEREQETEVGDGNDSNNDNNPIASNSQHKQVSSKPPPPPIFHKVEFELLENARKAYAVVQNVKVRQRKQQSLPASSAFDVKLSDNSGTDPTAVRHEVQQQQQQQPPIRLSLSINEDPSSDSVPSSSAGTILNVSELPPTCAHAGAVYDHFIEFGPVFRVTIGQQKGTAQIIYYIKEDADKAETEMHFSTIDDFQIIVRRPSKYDIKDSFKNPKLLPMSVKSSSSSSSLSARAVPYPGLGLGKGRGITNLPYHQEYHQWGPGAVRAVTGARAGSGQVEGEAGRRTVSDEGTEGSITTDIPYTRSRFSATAQPFEPSTSNPTSQDNDGISVNTEQQPQSQAIAKRTVSASGASSSRYATTDSNSSSFPNVNANVNHTAPYMLRSISQPIKFSDPTRLIVQNVPLDLRASTLFQALYDFIPSDEAKLLEASLALNPETKRSQGIAVLKYDTLAHTMIALNKLNGNYLPGYEDNKEDMPLRVKLFEPKGYVEKGLEFNDKSTSSGANESALVSNAHEVTKGVDSNKKEASSLSSSSSSTNLTHTRSSSSHSTPENVSTIINKHRKLLSTALDDLPSSESSTLFTSSNDRVKLLDLLLEKLPEEERRRCILEERYLVKRSMALKELYLEGGEVDSFDRDNADETGTPESTSTAAKVYERKELLNLYSPHSPTHPKTEAMIASLSQERKTKTDSANINVAAGETRHSIDIGNLEKDLPDIVTSPSAHTSSRDSQENQQTTSITPEAMNPWSNPTIGSNEQTKNITLDTLARTSVKAIMELANGQDPPMPLKVRNSATTRSVEMFMESISSLKSSQQKQKIGEKVFKVFKSHAPGMKNISKRTVALLDQEDLKSLMHLSEEFPEVLVAKASAMLV